MTAAERLLALAGTTGTAATLLLLIGQGATTGDALVNYAGTSGTAAELLLTEITPTAPTFVMGLRRPIQRQRENDEALLVMLGLL